MSPPMLYLVDTWGPPLGLGTAADPRWCTLSGVAKINGPKAAYAVANEFICGRLALALGLPAPPGMIVPAEASGHAYVSLRFGKANERPPPVIAAHAVEDNPSFAAGIVAFDNWIGNNDRHNKNLAYSRGLIGLAIFDHERALLGCEAGKGIDRLTTLQGKPVVVGCLPGELKTAQHLLMWSKRIAAVPSELVEELCRTASGLGVATPDESNAAAKFLEDRKPISFDLLSAAKAALPNVKDW